jgi:channel protein (hemolysin III family)
MDVTSLAPRAIPGFSDPVSSISHLLVGAPIFLVLTIVLLVRGRGDIGRQISLGIYGLCNIFLFTISGVYHLLEAKTTGRLVLQHLDHAAIFLMIAGTFTPPHWILFKGWQRWAPLTIVWFAAIAGVVFKTIFFRQFPETLGLGWYLALGWFGALSSYFIWYRHGLLLFRPLLWGAVAYTFGAVCDYLRWPVLIPHVLANHECFHIAVLIGAGCHAYFLYLIAAGPPPVVARDETDYASAEEMQSLRDAPAQ